MKRSDKEKKKKKKDDSEVEKRERERGKNMKSEEKLGHCNAVKNKMIVHIKSNLYFHFY